MYKTAPWREHMPRDLPAQNVNLEAPRQVVDWYYLSLSAFNDGEWPLWNPYQFMGVPLIGSYQTAVFYPPRLLFPMLGDLFTAMTVFVLLKLWLAGMLAYICARALAVAPLYASFFSVAYMLSGNMMTLYSYTPVDSMAWAPLLFLGIEYLVAGRWLKGFASCLVASTLMALAAGAQHTLTFSSMLGVYFVLRLIGAHSIRRSGRAIAIAASAGIVAALVTAIQMLPFIETMSQSLTALESLYKTDASDYRLTLADAPVLWSPWYFGTYLHGNYWGRLNPFYLMIAYVGIPCWVAASLAFGAAGPRRARISSLLVTCMASAWLAFGGAGAQIVTQLPGFASVRLIYFVSFMIFAFPFAATEALEQWVAADRKRKSMRPPIVLAALIPVVLIAHAFLNQPTLQSLSEAMERSETIVDSLMTDGSAAFPLASQDGTLNAYVWRQVLWSAMLLAASVVVLYAIRAKRLQPSAGIAGMIGVLVIDALSTWGGMQPTSKRDHLFPPIPAFDLIRAQGHPFRVNYDEVGINGLAIPYGLEELQGYDAMVPTRFWTTMRADLPMNARIALDRTAATRWYVYPAPKSGDIALPEGFELVRAIDGVVVAMNKRSLDRARLVASAEVVGSHEELLARVSAADFDPANLALVEGPNAIDLRAENMSPPGAAHITEWGWNHVEVQVDAVQPAVLVLAEAYYPGWEARIDNSHYADIFPVYHVLRGVRVPEGRHTVTFRYRPLSFRIGAAVSVFTLCVLLVCALLLIFGSRRKIGVRE